MADEYLHEQTARGTILDTDLFYIENPLEAEDSNDYKAVGSLVASYVDTKIGFTGHTHLEADITDLQAYLLNITGESLSDLSDVNTATTTNRFVLVADGVDFESRLLIAEDLSDFDVSTLSEGSVLEYEVAPGKWVSKDKSTAGISEVGHTHLEADITDLQSYLLNITGESVDDLSDVNVGVPVGGEVLVYNGPGFSWDGRLLLEADISDLQTYLLSEVNDLTAAVTWANIPDANVPETAVTQHEAALAILWSQITGEPTEFPVAVSKNSGATVGTRDTLNFIEGTNVTMTIADDGPGGEVDITINSSGGGAGQLSDLSDVNTSTPTNRFALVADGVDFESRLLVEADVSDLGTYLTDITGETIGDLSGVVITGAAKGDILVHNGSNWVDLTVGPNDDVLTADSAEVTGIKWATPSGGSPHTLGSHTDVTITTIAAGEILKWDGADWINNTLAEAGIAADTHAHQLTDLTDVNTAGVTARFVLVADGVDYESRLLVEADISDLGSYLTAEVNDLSVVVTWANIPDANVPESAVTQHEAALAILWSQITGEPTEYPVAVSKNSGATVGTRATLNFIEGTNVTMTIADDAGGDEVDITINSSGGGAGQLSDLSDVNTSTPTNQFVLVADGVDFESRALVAEDLSDFDVSTLSDGMILEYEISPGNWISRTKASAGISEIGHTHPIGDLSDVVITGAVKGDLLVFNGTNWVDLTVGTNTWVLTADSVEATGVKWAAPGAGVVELSDLSDVNTSTPTDKFVLVADGVDFESRLLVEADISNLGTYLTDITGEVINDLDDVVITSVNDNDILAYNTGTSKWINQSASEALLRQITARKNSGGTIGPRSRINLIEGSNITITLTDDSGDDEFDITIASTGGGATQLTDLTDVNTAGVTNRFCLVADGVDYESRFLVEADISDLGSYITGITGEPLSDLSDVTIASIGAFEILMWNGANWLNRTFAEAGIADDDHSVTHENTGSDEISVTGLSGQLADGQKVAVSKNSGATVGTRSVLNLIEGSGITLTIADDAGGDEVDVTVTATAGGATLEALTDVTITAAAKGDILVHNGSVWVDLTIGTNDFVLTADSAQSTGVKWAAAAGGGGGGEGKYVARMVPDTTPATLEWHTPTTSTSPKEQVELINFVDTASKYMDFMFIYRGYGSGGTTIELWFRSIATSGNVKMQAAIRRMQSDTEDLSTTHTYDYNFTTMSVPNDADKYKKLTITFTDGADSDSVADGDMFILRLKRDSNDAADTCGNDILITRPLVYET